MRHLVIIGGGFAGFWSAMSAARQVREMGKRDALKITLISKDQYHSIRPRFYERTVEGMKIPLKKYLDPLKIDLVIGEVSNIDAEERRLSFRDGPSDIFYDDLILAAGSRLKSVGFPGIGRTFNVDTFEEASRLDRHLRNLAAAGFPTEGSINIVVVGGGFTGLEVVTSMPQRLATPRAGNGFQFFLVDRSTTLASNYSPEARQYILDQLEKAGIHLLLGEELERIEDGEMILKSGRTIKTETVVRTIGLEASPLTANLKGDRDHLGRLCVDPFLRLSAYDHVFIAGDVARASVDDQNASGMSCQHAIPQGRVAGHNAVNLIFGGKPVPYSQPRYVTCLDLGGEQALFTTGWERTVQTVGPEAKALKNQIVTEWIYPAEDPEETVRMSAPEIPERA